MADEKGKRTSKEILDAAQYREAVSAMEKGDMKAKTKVAYFKLSGVGGVEVDEDEAVVLLEERAKDGDNEAMWIQSPLAMTFACGGIWFITYTHASTVPPSSSVAGTSIRS